MKHTISILAIALLAWACNGQQEVKKADEKEVVKTETQPDKPGFTAADIPVVDFDGLLPLLSSDSDTTYVVNFWATWCKPCVAELPYFEEYHEKYKNEKVKVLLISMDFPKQIEKKLVPFINNRDLQPEVVLLDAPDPNSWIDKVDPEWSGAIPITIIFKKDKRGFFEQSFHSLEELEETIDKVVKG